MYITQEDIFRYSCGDIDHAAVIVPACGVCFVLFVRLNAFEAGLWKVFVEAAAATIADGDGSDIYGCWFGFGDLDGIGRCKVA